MSRTTSSLSTATDPLPIGEYVVDASSQTSYVIVGFDEARHAWSRTRTYEAIAPEDGRRIWLHEGLSPLDLEGALTLSACAAAETARHLARLSSHFEMPWFDKVVRHYLVEPILPHRLSDAQLNQQPKAQWEAWFEQLALGLSELHACGVAFGFDSEEAVLPHIAVRDEGGHAIAYWQQLGTLVALTEDPEAQYDDVRALCAALAHTRLIEAQSHVRYALQRAADPRERITAAMLLNGIRRVRSGSARTAGADDLHAELGYATSTGMVRKDNEDNGCAMEITPAQAWNGKSAHKPILLAVADGMGGIEAGEVASALAIQALTDAARALFNADKIPTPPQLCDWVQQTVKDINALVVAEGTRRGNQMGTTLAFALVVNGWAYLGNVGDSRIYLWRPQQHDASLVRLVKDHSLVQSLVDAGMLRDEDRYAHPERSLILRSLGDPKTGTSDVNDPVQLQPGDWLLVCSDGLWEMVRDDAMRDVLIFSANAQVACDRLVDLANANGGEDNIAVAIGRFF